MCKSSFFLSNFIVYLLKVSSLISAHSITLQLATVAIHFQNKLAGSPQLFITISIWFKALQSANALADPCQQPGSMVAIHNRERPNLIEAKTKWHF